MNCYGNIRGQRTNRIGIIMKIHADKDSERAAGNEKMRKKLIESLF